ncbi:hypothetical protein HOLleu_37743 [Holothuria leucospilota]|uniref:Uncharacterized protein n=1 Tax=Holothuria leucospilota TaxID=206669 RepID=A0A9Q0YPE6_HOLLE|nr:hypothetical protein HOLleu_37743 [Holothuria leucospilota]
MAGKAAFEKLLWEKFPGKRFCLSGFWLRKRDFFTCSYVLGSKSNKKKGRKQSGFVSNTSHGDKDPRVVSPSTIQVFSDSQLAQTVRDLAVSFQKTKNDVKNLREDMEDCSFEVLRQSQSTDTLETAVAEVKKLVKQKCHQDMPKLANDLHELEENVVYFSKLAANQENRLLDMNDNVQAALSKFSNITKHLETFRKSLEKLEKDSEETKKEATAAFVDAKMVKKELKNLRAEITSIRKNSPQS